MNNKLTHTKNILLGKKENKPRRMVYDGKTDEQKGGKSKEILSMK